jgi:hypothetical protein
MTKSSKTYSVYQKASAIFMILALCWLTVSTPFVYDYQQEIAKQEKMSDTKAPLAEEETNPLNSATEEKTPNAGNSISEEYIHDHHTMDNLVTGVSPYNKCHNDDIYHAYHGELLVPPPNVL